ncbi:hypothetical protein B296_00035942 [Ensete ventricosum]|uniref:Uncharacterized protein n=1 Tax=Ensete ventricosum TaxID=4639 RepID=A0A426ZZS5_ENSVE|nr:hypothetical protein B296_00035942 [Ensete ventricosum]
MEDYGFEYSDEEPEEQDVDIENQYYNSKGNLSIVIVFDGLPTRPYVFLQRLWFKTNLKLCTIWFDIGEYGRMSKVFSFL